MSIFITFFIFFTTAVFLKWLWDRRKLYKLSMQVQGPFALPIVGNIWQLIKLLQDRNPHRVFLKIFNDYPKMCRTWLGPYLHLMVLEPEYVESVFQKSVVAKSPLVYDGWREAMGYGLVTMTANGKDPAWKMHSKLLTPTLSINAISYYYEHIQKNCHLLLEDMDSLCDRGIVDFTLVLHRFVADVISESMFGVEMNFRRGERDELFEAVESMADSVFQKSIRIWYIIRPFYNMSALGRKQIKATKMIVQFCQELLAIKTEGLDPRRNIKCSEYSTMEVLLKAQSEGLLSKNEVFDEVMNIWNAATDTAGLALEFSILMLAMNQECQEKAFQEIKEYYKGDIKAEVQRQDLKHFVYLDMFIKETLRLYPTGPMVAKYASEEFEVKGGIKVPVGTYILIFSYLTQRDPKIWKNPNEFRPERFLPEEVAKRHPYSYFPFSAGPRKCIGRAFAKTLLITSMIHLIRTFKFENSWSMDELPLLYDINVRSAWGYKAKIIRREWN